jgi:hypothetical protein
MTKATSTRAARIPSATLSLIGCLPAAQFTAAPAARQHGTQLVLAAAEQLFEIGQRWVLAVSSLASCKAPGVRV